MLRQNGFQAADECLDGWGPRSLTAAPEQESSIIGTKERNHTHTHWHQSPTSQRQTVIRSPCIDFSCRGIYGKRRNTVIVLRAASLFICFNWPAALFNRLSADRM